MKRRRGRGMSTDTTVRRTERTTRSATQHRANEVMSEGDESVFLLECVDKLCPDVERDLNTRSSEMETSLQETLMAFVDDERGVEEFLVADKFTFLDAIYSRCIVQSNPYVPTKRILESILHTIQQSQSAELTHACSCLLQQLEKRHPRIAVAGEVDEISGSVKLKVDIDEKVWSPLDEAIRKPDHYMMLDSSKNEGVPLNLVALMEQVAKDLTIPPAERNQVKVLGQYRMLQHLVVLLQKDFYSRVRVSQANMDGTLVLQSYLYKLLLDLPSHQRKLLFSSLLSILSPSSQRGRLGDEESDEQEEIVVSENQDADSRTEHDILLSSVEFGHLASKLLLMVVTVYLLTRSDNIWSSYLLEVFSKASDLEIGLQAIYNPYVKIRFILDFFATFAPMTPSQTLDLKDLNKRIDCETLKNFLNCFGEDKTPKFLHKFKEHVLPILLGNAFQAFLLVRAEAGGDGDMTGRSRQHEETAKICKSVADALIELKDLEGQTKMRPFAEFTLGMANSILVNS